jgi:S-formylglutathione hydrolase FrmB
MSQLQINLHSKILAVPVDLTVILPDPPANMTPGNFYSSGKKYKTLWLLHGGNADWHDWLNQTNAARELIKRSAMAVIPNGLNSDFANHPEFADGYNYLDFFFDELMPFMHNWFPASSDPKDNFITGYSMGGAGTWMYGLLHPEKFGGIAPLSSALRRFDYLEPYRDLAASEFKTLALKDRTRFPAGYGDPKGGIQIKEINMIAKYQKVGDFLDSPENTWRLFHDTTKKGTMPLIFAACGKNDRSCEKLYADQEEALKLGINNITFYFAEGAGHDYVFWDDVIPRVLDFFKI